MRFTFSQVARAQGIAVSAVRQRLDIPTEREGWHVYVPAEFIEREITRLRRQATELLYRAQGLSELLAGGSK